MNQKNTHTTFLKGKKAKAVQALISCDTIDEACQECSVSRSTIYRYMADPIFDAELKKAKRLLINRAVMRLQQSCRDAANALSEICRDKDAPSSARVSAAREILSGALKAVEIESIEERLKSLEEKFLRN